MTLLEFAKELLSRIDPKFAVIIVVVAMFFTVILHRINTRAFLAALCITVLVIVIAVVSIFAPRGETIVISGLRTFETDEALEADRIVFKAGTKVRVLHGSRLTFKAEEIEVEGPVTIDGTGDVGAPGRDGGKGSPTTVLRQYRESWTSGAGGGNSATQNWQSACSSGHPDNHGEDGGTGGPGGPGATIYFIAPSQSGSDFVACMIPGGRGGAGGRGGEGRTHINGDNPSMTCLGPPGHDGVPGQIGPSGECKWMTEAS